MHRGERRGSVWRLIIGLSTAVAIALLIVIPRLASASLQNLSNSDHGDDLGEVIMGLMNENYEVLALFDVDGKKLLEWTSYSQDQVKTPLEWFSLANSYAVDGITALHNHPVDSSFSKDDLLMASSANCKREMIVTPSSLYILEAARGWPTRTATEEFFQSMVYDDYSAALAQGYIFESQDTIYCTTAELIKLYAETFDLQFSVQTLNR